MSLAWAAQALDKRRVPALRLFLQLVAYYAILALVGAALLFAVPTLGDFLPIGRVQTLIAAAPGAAARGSQVAHLDSFGGSLIWLTSAVGGALITALPVSWTYMQIRADKDYDQSQVDTIVVLPLVVTGIVVIVQHSLALSFSLAGIAGAARFRNSLKSTGDLLFMLLATAIGLSAGIGAMELAIVLSAAFNFTFVALWATDYGERAEMKRFLGDIPPHRHATSVTATTAVVTEVTERFDEDGEGGR